MVMKEWVCFGLVRLLLPATLLAACILRINGFSLLYGCLLLLEPITPTPSPDSIAGSTGGYLILTVVCCSLTLLAQIIFQAYLLITASDQHPYGSILTNCSTLEKSLRQLGLQRLEQDDYGNILRVILPDICAFLVALIVLILCRVLLRSASTASTSQPQRSSVMKQRLLRHSGNLANVLLNLLVIVFLAMSGVAKPALLSSVYLLTFLAVCTWLALSRGLGRGYVVVQILLMVYSASHLILLYLYQFQFFQEAVPPDGFVPKLVGLTAIVKTDCRKPWLLFFYEVDWPVLVSPGVILLLYLTLACEVRRWFTRIREREESIHRGKRSRVSSSSERQVYEEEYGDDGDESLVASDRGQPNYNTMDQTSVQLYQETDGHSVGMVSDGTHPPPTSHKKRSALESIGVYIMRQSYVGTLIVMMAWSITYHSWLTFVYLLWACIIWLIPSKRTVCLHCSPVIVFYAMGLILVQYTWGLDVPLPDTTPSGFKLSDIGPRRVEYPCLTLGVQVLFTVMFWITMRQFMQEWRQHKEDSFMNDLALQVVESTEDGEVNQHNIHDSPTNVKDGTEGTDGEAVKAVGRYIWHMFCKYWILVCTGMFLLMALQEAVIYRIIYMVLFLYFIISFQMCYTWWRLTSTVFWWVVIVYSMVVVGVVYTYQFEEIPWGWLNDTNIDPLILADIGLEKFNTGTLFIKLLTPTAFLIIIIIQLHYFQKPFLQLSDVNRLRGRRPKRRWFWQKKQESVVDTSVIEDTGGAADAPEEVPAESAEPGPSSDLGQCLPDQPIKKKSWRAKFVEGFSYVWHTLYSMLDTISAFLWRLLEVHIIKAVMFTIFICCLVEVTAVNVVLVVLVVIGITSPSLHCFMSYAASCWVALVVLAKMTYQLSFISIEDSQSNCSYVDNLPDDNMTFPYPFNETINSALYIGLEKNSNLADYLKNYIFILLMLGFEGVVKIHQRQHWGHPARTRPFPGIIFPDIGRRDADKGLVECAMFFVNYAFYKFGLQLCFIMTMVTMVVRLDIYSVLYGVFLGVLLLLNRRVCYRFWPFYMLVLIILLTLQYLSSLGVPPGLCWAYPWNFYSWMTPNLTIYLYLPNYANPPVSIKLLADFFQLLFVCLQWWVFQIENGSDRDRYGGGSNKSIFDELENSEANPVEDFLSYKDSYLDYLKAILFQYSFWVTLIVVFIAGTSRISLFCLGYLVACFFFLWFGQELLMKPLRNLVKLWGILLGYNYFVILAKSGLQLVGCVYRLQLAENYCWVIQLFSILCVRSGNYNTDDNDQSQSKCRLDNDEAGLTWDAICFVFLLLMLRVYKSHYFCHVVTELQVQNSLAARGAELINTSLIKTVCEQKDREETTLSNIKRKMDRIKIRQERLQSKAIVESDDHYVVIRSGDYYMFEDDSDIDEDTSIDDLELTADPNASDPEDDDKVGPLQIIDAALKSGTKEALEVAERKHGRHRTSECSSDGDDRPVSRRRSSRTSEPTQPGTSGGATGGEDPSLVACEFPDEEVSEDEDEDGAKKKKKKESLCTKLRNGAKLVWAIFCGLLDYLIVVLHDISREYRSVSRILDREKEEEKIKIRKARELVETHEDSPDSLGHSSEGEPSIRRAPSSTRRPTDISLQIEKEQQDITILQRELDIDTKKDAEKEFQRGMPRVFQLITAAVEVLLSRSDVLCYFAMILNVLVSASLLSLPYPISVFLWALLSVPRPSKTYWVTIITYTEAVVVVKYLFQFGFFPWNLDVYTGDSPFWPPRIIGIEKKSNYAVFDLILLFCLFVHRSVLKRYGLWKDLEDIEEDFARAERNIASRATTPIATPTTNVPAIEQPSGAEDDQTGLINVTFEKSSTQSDLNTLAPAGEGEHSEECPRKEAKPKRGLLSSVFAPFKSFYQQMTNPKYNAVTDVYASMFLCDFITFVIVVFGYTAFGPATAAAGPQTVTNVIQDNKVPPLFLAMLLVQFVLIIVDRGLYLRKQVLGKFLFQILLVILVHVWLFFILPAVTERPFTQNLPAQLWYFTKCIYFGLSAYQIRSAYPTRILGNFLTKKFNYANLFLFKGFLLIPFLLELRALMDWMWTDTTLALTSWLQMEDIYANIFVLKCWRRAEKEYPTPRGQKRKAPIKYGVGGLLLFLLIFIIWFPLLLFSLSSAIFEPNPPIDCTIQMQFGEYQPIYQMSAQQSNMQPISDSDYSKLNQYYSNDAAASAFLAGYQQDDVYISSVKGSSTATWDISPPSVAAFNTSLLNDNSVNLFTTISFTRQPSSGSTSDTVSKQYTRSLNASSSADMNIRKNLSLMLTGNITGPVPISYIYPAFMTVPVSNTPEAAFALTGSLGPSGNFTAVNFTLQREPATSVEWWELKTPPLDFLHMKTSQDLIIVSFNERIAPGAFSFFTSYGVIGLYVSVVIVIGQFVRIFFSGTSSKIMFEQLPYVERIYKLCMDIYLVRESYDFCLEEELYSKLIFLYRSPETLIKWTKFKNS